MLRRMASRRVLVQFAHPVLERSQVNRPLIDAVAALPGVTVNDLYEQYPTLAIDVAREQELLVAHDVIVFHHPFYWYSTPALLKQWQDMVLEHGWAYGEGGTALTGKITFNVVTTGGPANAYRREGYNRFTVRQLLAPYEQTASLCRMIYLAPFVTHAALRLPGKPELEIHLAAYRDLLVALRDDRLDLAVAGRVDDMLEALPELIRPEAP
jgi:glutathione-regulated potassium-efflux system ancillary protein KefG